MFSLRLISVDLHCLCTTPQSAAHISSFISPVMTEPPQNAERYFEVKTVVPSSFHHPSSGPSSTSLHEGSIKQVYIIKLKEFPSSKVICWVWLQHNNNPRLHQRSLFHISHHHLGSVLDLQEQEKQGWRRHFKQLHHLQHRTRLCQLQPGSREAYQQYSDARGHDRTAGTEPRCSQVCSCDHDWDDFNREACPHQHETLGDGEEEYSTTSSPEWSSYSGNWLVQFLKVRFS